MTLIFYCEECDQRYGGQFPRPAAGNCCQDCGDALTLYRRIRDRIADRIDGYDRDDLGESPDF